VSLLLVYKVHQLLKLVFSLKSLLLWLSSFFAFLLHNDFFLFVRVVQIISFNWKRDKVTFHALNHMTVSPLKHQFKVMLILNHS
jgi:hypothetical protein